MSFATKQLDSDSAAFIEKFAMMWQQASSLQALREQRKQDAKRQELEPVHSVEEVLIGGPHGPIPLRIIRPSGEERLPVFLYFHRGGWVLGSNDESEGFCRRISNRAEAIVVSVDFRLAPEHPFPIPLDECLAATEWALENLGDPQRVGVGGESAGGNLAAAVALKLKQKLSYQLLMYPILTCTLDPKVYAASPDKAFLSLENMEYFLDAYVGKAERRNPYASPLDATDLSGLPTTYIVTGEFDPLHVEGERYAKKLQSAGVACKYLCFPGMIHGFLDLPIHEQIKEGGAQLIASWIRKN